MKSKKIISILCILFSSYTFFVICVPFAQAQDAPVYRVNLQDCIELALRNNEDLKAASYDILGSISKKIEATKRYVPVINYTYRMAPVPQNIDQPIESFFVDGDITVFNSIKIEAGVPITTFGQLTVSRELADIGIDASKLLQQKSANDIVLDIYKLYNGILLAREIKAIGNRGLDAVTNTLGELRKKETTDQLQILKLKVILHQVEKEMDDSSKKEIIALAMLKFRMGLEDDVNVQLKDHGLSHAFFPSKNYDELLSVSKEERPDFKLLQYQVDGNEKKWELEKIKYYPRLVLGGFFEYGLAPGITGDEDESSFSNPFNYTRGGVGVELSSELDFRKIKANVETAEAQHLKSIADKRSKSRQLELDLKNSYLDLDQKRKQLWRAEDEAKSGRQIVFLTKSNYDIGIGDKKDYLEALQSYLLIQTTALKSLYEYNVAVATVKSKMGVLFDKTKLTQAWE